VFTLGGPAAGTTTPTASFSTGATAANAIFSVKGGQASNSLGGLIFSMATRTTATVTVTPGQLAAPSAARFNSMSAPQATPTLRSGVLRSAAQRALLPPSRGKPPGVTLSLILAARRSAAEAALTWCAARTMTTWSQICKMRRS
jgi:hypothetical protein